MSGERRQRRHTTGSATATTHDTAVSGSCSLTRHLPAAPSVSPARSSVLRMTRTQKSCVIMARSVYSHRLCLSVMLSP